MKNTLGMLSILAAMSEMGDIGYSERSEYQELTDEEKEQFKAILEKKRIEKLKKQGVNEYFYGENVVYARDKKNADRKAKNKGWL